MSKSAATRAASRPRPVSPHLQIYRFIPTMAMSILHRITGCTLYVGTLLITWWLVAASISQEQFHIAAIAFGSWIGLIVLFGYTWVLMHHMMGGIRHLVWDTGTGLEKATSTRLAIAQPFISAGLTIIIWIVAVATWGAS